MGSMTPPPTLASVTTSVRTCRPAAPRAAATNRRVSSAKPARASVPLWPTQVCGDPAAGPSNPPHRTRSAGPCSPSQRVAPMPAARRTDAQQRSMVPSGVGVTIVGVLPNLVGRPGQHEEQRAR